MGNSPTKRNERAAHLEAFIRKALADAWATGATGNEAKRIAIHKVQTKFPEMSESEISELVQSLRSGSG